MGGRSGVQLTWGHPVESWPEPLFRLDPFIRTRGDR